MDRNEDQGQFNEDDHPDHPINRNVDEETESTNQNADVSGAGVTSQGESSSASDDVSRKRSLNPLEQNVVGHVQNADRETVQVVYAGTRVQDPPSIDRYLHLGLDANFRKPGRVDGVAVSGIVKKGRFSDFHYAAIRDDVSAQEDDTEVDRGDQAGGLLPKEAKKPKK